MVHDISLLVRCTAIWPRGRTLGWLGGTGGILDPSGGMFHRKIEINRSMQIAGFLGFESGQLGAEEMLFGAWFYGCGVFWWFIGVADNDQTREIPAAGVATSTSSAVALMPTSQSRIRWSLMWLCFGLILLDCF